MTTRARLMLLCVATLSGLCACATQYAILYINSAPPSAEIWSGKDGQFLGETPKALRFEKRAGDCNPTEVLIFKEKKFQTVFAAVIVDKWSDTWLDAQRNQNTLHVELIDGPPHNGESDGLDAGISPPDGGQ